MGQHRIRVHVYLHVSLCVIEKEVEGKRAACLSIVYTV